tara:strand:+ start:2751 stop:3056 length:306 start_codon:yes stop_codon:yes gene_type:complete
MIVDVNTSLRILETISLAILIGIGIYLAYVAVYIFIIVFGGLFIIVHLGAYGLIFEENDLYLKLAGIFTVFILFHLDNILVHHSIEFIYNLRYYIDSRRQH